VNETSKAVETTQCLGADVNIPLGSDDFGLIVGGPSGTRNHLGLAMWFSERLSRLPLKE
jgi:hypothetical protein